MGNALYINWDDTQKYLYNLQLESSIAFGSAIGTVMTHYCVAAWIWNSKMKDKDKSPSFVLSMLMLWTLWTLGFNTSIAGTNLAQRIAITILGLGGFIANLLFSGLWHFMQNHASRSEAETVTTSTALTSPLLEEDNTAPTDGTLTEADETAAEELPIGADEEAAPELLQGSPKQKTPLHWINNLKIFLAFVVILHHCYSDFGGWWPGLMSMNSNFMNWGNLVLASFQSTNASYFMNLFFFYSGFFVPKSFDKKKCYDFLFDRVRRLGIPFVVYAYLAGPCIEEGLASLFFGLPFPNSTVNPDVTWFLNQLMLFSVVYAFACGIGWTPKIKCPSLLGFLMIGATIGFFTGILLIFFPNADNFFAVPNFWQDFPSYPLYFIGGAIAQRNRWMEVIKEEKSRVAIYGLVVLIWVVNVILVFMVIDPGEVPVGFPYSNNPIISILQATFYKGLMSVTVSLALSTFFMDYLNKSFRSTQFFSKSMYTAYIIQAPIIEIGLKVMTEVFKSTGNIVYTDPSNPSIYNMKFVNDNLVFPAWLLVSVISLTIVWPLAYAIRAIPGFSKVL